MYELVHMRDEAIEPFQGVFYTFLDAHTYSTCDLYIPHPTRESWWRSAGRVDIVVIVVDAKKLNPMPSGVVIEESIQLLQQHQSAAPDVQVSAVLPQTEAVAAGRRGREPIARRGTVELQASERGRTCSRKTDQRGRGLDEES